MLPGRRSCSRCQSATRRSLGSRAQPADEARAPGDAAAAWCEGSSAMTSRAAGRGAQACIVAQVVAEVEAQPRGASCAIFLTKYGGDEVTVAYQEDREALIKRRWAAAKTDMRSLVESLVEILPW